MTTQSPRNVMWDPRIVVPFVLVAALSAIVSWILVADPFGGTVTGSTPSTIGARPAVTPGNAVPAKPPKGSSLLPMQVTAAEKAAVEAGDYKAVPYLSWLADLGPWYEADAAKFGGRPTAEPSYPLRPQQVLFLARDGRTWVATKAGTLRIHEPAYRTKLPSGVTATVHNELQTVEIVDANAGRTYTAGIGQPFILAVSADQGNSDVFAVLKGGDVLEIVDFEK